MVESELEDMAWKDYIANILCLIARPNYESEIPMYTDLIDWKKAVEDNRTAEEIYNSVIGKLEELEKKEA